MKSIFIESPITFSGEQLQPNWVSDTTGTEEDVIVAFIGPSQLILNENDTSFLDNKDLFVHPNMLHFVASHSHTTYKEMILYQRLFLAAAIQHLPDQVDCKALNLYYQNRQLTITHIQVNPNAAIFHVGFFIDPEKTPPVQGLTDFGLVPTPYAVTVMQAYSKEANLIPKFNPHNSPHTTL